MNKIKEAFTSIFIAFYFLEKGWRFNKVLFFTFFLFSFLMSLCVSYIAWAMFVVMFFCLLFVGNILVIYCSDFKNSATRDFVLVWRMITGFVFAVALFALIFKFILFLVF